jgi:hypothetical protein
MAKDGITCKEDGCKTKVLARGRCQIHYDAWRRNPNSDYEPALRLPTVERFWSLVDKDGPTMPDMDTPCWVWTRADHGNGYGRFYYGGKKCAYAHRVAYEIANGFEIGELSLRFVVDHKCHNKVCCNPFHLRGISQKQNVENRKGAQCNNISTGVRGVSKVGNRFHIHVRGRYCGSFATIEEATEARVALANKLFTHNDAERKTA